MYITYLCTHIPKKRMYKRVEIQKHNINMDIQTHGSINIGITHGFFICIQTYTENPMQICIHTYMWIYKYVNVGWLRLVDSLKLQVSFAKYCRFYRSLLQKRPIISRSLLSVATPQHTNMQMCMNIVKNTYKWTSQWSNRAV